MSVNTLFNKISGSNLSSSDVLFLQIFLFTSLGVVVIGLVVAIYAAGLKPSSVTTTPKPTITLNQQNPRVGQSINFTVANAPAASTIQVGCYQNALLVWAEQGTTTASFTLAQSSRGKSDSLWQKRGGGAANCYAILFQGKPSGVLASTTFSATAQ